VRERAEDLLARGRVEVVRRLVEQQHVGARDDERRERQAGLLPPESTPAGFSTSSPVNRNEPSTLRASVALMSGAADIMFSSTERLTSRFSCSCA
jgi:hypothetical protein